MLILIDIEHNENGTFHHFTKEINLVKGNRAFHQLFFSILKKLYAINIISQDTTWVIKIQHLDHKQFIIETPYGPIKETP